MDSKFIDVEDINMSSRNGKEIKTGSANIGGFNRVSGSGSAYSIDALLGLSSGSLDSSGGGGDVTCDDDVEAAQCARDVMRVRQAEFTRTDDSSGNISKYEHFLLLYFCNLCFILRYISGYTNFVDQLI